MTSGNPGGPPPPNDPSASPVRFFRQTYSRRGRLRSPTASAAESQPSSESGAELNVGDPMDPPPRSPQPGPPPPPRSPRPGPPPPPRSPRPGPPSPRPGPPSPRPPRTDPPPEDTTSLPAWALGKKTESPKKLTPRRPNRQTGGPRLSDPQPRDGITECQVSAPQEANPQEMTARLRLWNPPRRIGILSQYHITDESNRLPTAKQDPKPMSLGLPVVPVGKRSVVKRLFSAIDGDSKPPGRFPAPHLMSSRPPPPYDYMPPMFDIPQAPAFDIPRMVQEQTKLNRLHRKGTYEDKDLQKAFKAVIEILLGMMGILELSDAEALDLQKAIKMSRGRETD